MSKLDGITKGTRIETTGAALCFEDGVGLVGTVLKTTDTHAYVKLDDRPNIDRRTINGVSTACTVYYWPYIKTLPETPIMIGDTVKVLETSAHGSYKHMKGVIGEVLDTTSGNGSVLVKDPTGKGMWPREGGLGWWLSRHAVEKVVPKIELKAGDTVRVIRDGGFSGKDVPSVGDILEVKKVSSSGDLVYTTSGYSYWYGHKSYGDEVAPEPLAAWERELLVSPFLPKKEEPRKLQVGDTVRFLENGLRTTVGSTGKIIEVHGPHCTYRYRVTSGSQPSDRGSLYEANEIEYIEETNNTEETVVNQEIKTGDIVEAIESMSGVVKGTRYTVKGVRYPEDVDRMLVDVKGATAYARRFKLVTPEQVALKIGDKVKVLHKTRWATDRYIGQTGVVCSEVSGDDIEVKMSDGTDFWYGVDSLELVTTKSKSKSKSTEIQSHEIQKGDLIVAFWNEGGVETRRKGIAHENDGDDDWMTEDGEYLNYDDNASNCSASHIYLINRPEPVKEPEIADGTYWVSTNGHALWYVKVVNETAEWFVARDDSTAFADYAYLLRVKAGKVSDQKFLTEDPRKPIDLLDKSKVYVAKPKDSYGSEYLLAHKGGEWRFVNKAHTKNGVTEDAAPVEGVEGQLIEGKTSWFKPVEYIAPPKSVQEQLDDLKVKATDVYYLSSNSMYYQFIGEGKVKFFAGTTSQERVATSGDIRRITKGDLVKTA